MAAGETIVILVSLEIDIRLLSDPGGRDMGVARSPDGEGCISQVAPPEKK